MVSGILLPSSVLQSGWFQVLAAFVDLNTLTMRAELGEALPTPSRVTPA